VANIYDIPTWAASTLYQKDSIVINGSYFYYSTQLHTSSSSFSTDLSSNKWRGTIQMGRDTKTYFGWIPSYNYRNVNEPKVKVIQFSDGYAVRQNDGISNLLLSFDFSFANRGLSETTAILHFLSSRAGSESFIFQAPAAYGKLKRFVCPTWTDTQNFFDNYTIDAKFVEVVV
jgi:phage-related protein